MRITILTLALVLLFSSVQIFAQNTNETYRKITEINHIGVLENLKSHSFDNILKRKINDSQNRAVGDLNDVLVKQSGEIDALMITLNRLHLDQQISVQFNTGLIEAEYAFYVFKSHDSAQIENRFPELLANMVTASGNDDIVAVSKLIDSRVKNERGITIARVRDVLFNTEGTKARALLLVTLDKRNVIAVPFDIGMITGDLVKEVIVAEEQEKAISNFLKSR